MSNRAQLGLILKSRLSSLKWAQVELYCSFRLGATVLQSWCYFQLIPSEQIWAIHLVILINPMWIDQKTWEKSLLKDIYMENLFHNWHGGWDPMGPLIRVPKKLKEGPKGSKLSKFRIFFSLLIGIKNWGGPFSKDYQVDPLHGVD